MRNVYQYFPDDSTQFINKALLWANRFEKLAFLKNSKYKNRLAGNEFESLLAIDELASISSSATNSFSAFEKFSSKNRDWRIGYFSYDLKNELENLSSSNADGLGFPLIQFFVPKYLIIQKENFVEFHIYEDSPKFIIDKILNFEEEPVSMSSSLNFYEKVSKQKYIENVKSIKQDIAMGDIYELNYCVEFFNSEAEIVPLKVFQNLVDYSPTPFASYLAFNQFYLMSASPERYLKKKGNRVLSQPIKGTIRRGINDLEDNHLKKMLRTSPKERAENVMIVDLVRNDLSRVAKPASVKLLELCGIYSYPTVHQMISTIEAQIHQKDWLNVIKESFPMGSMTGAPKVRAMKRIEEYEESKRGLYSGAVGYFTPENDFDFNVVIRSVLYNASNKYLSVSVGGAITSLSVPEDEYAECMLKAKAIFATLNSKVL